MGKYKFSKPVNPFDYAEKRKGDIEIIQGNPCSGCLNELGNEFKSLGKYHEKLKNITILVAVFWISQINYEVCIRKYWMEINHDKIF